MTPTGGRPRQLAEIDRGLGMAGAQQHAAVARDQREDVARPGEVVGAGIRVGERPAAGGALVRRDAGAAVGLVVDRHREGGGMGGIIVGDHRIEPQPPRILGRDRRADDAGGVADDERHLLRGAERGRDDQIALALAVVVIGHDDELAPGEGLQHVRNRIGHTLNRLSLFLPGWISRTWAPAPASRRRSGCRGRVAAWTAFRRAVLTIAAVRLWQNLAALAELRVHLGALVLQEAGIGRLDHRKQLAVPR